MEPAFLVSSQITPLPLLLALTTCWITHEAVRVQLKIGWRFQDAGNTRNIAPLLETLIRNRAHPRGKPVGCKRWGCKGYPSLLERSSRHMCLISQTWHYSIEYFPYRVSVLFWSHFNLMSLHYSFLEQKHFLCHHVLEVCNIKGFFLIFIFMEIHTSKLDLILIGDFKLHFFFFYIYVFICNVCLYVHIYMMGEGMHVPQCTCGSQRTIYRHQFSPSTMWVSETELR